MIFDRIDYIRQSLKRLEEFKELSKEEFLANDDYFAIAEHHLRRGIEAILDIGRHICVSDRIQVHSYHWACSPRLFDR